MIIDFNKLTENQKVYMEAEKILLEEKEKGLEYFLKYTYSVVNNFLNALELKPMELYPEEKSLRDQLEVTAEAWAFVSSYLLEYSYKEEGAIGGIKRGSKVLKYLADEKFRRWGIEILEENSLEFVDLTADGVLVREK